MNASDPPQRDVRVDFLRGLALLVIFIDHTEGNLFAKVTYHLFGFWDAAEWFVLLSGYAVGIAYTRVLASNGLWAVQMKAAHRCTQLYLAHMATFTIAFVLLRSLVRPDASIAVGGIDFSYLQLESFEGLWRLATLQHLPPLFDILPVYIAFLLATPVFLAGAARFGWAAALAVSFGLYLLPIFDPGYNLPNLPHGSWYLNPCSWQLLFFTGLTVGARRSITPAEPPRWLWKAALTVAVLGFVAKHAALLLFHSVDVIPMVGKTDLGPILLLHFAACAYLTFRALDVWGFWTRFAAPIVTCGRHSLPLFCLGIVLSIAASFVLTHFSGYIAQVTCNIVGLSALVAAGYLLDRTKRTVEPIRRPQPERVPVTARP